MAGIVNSYETVLVLSTKLGEEGIASTVEKFKALISANGTIDVVDEWGKRKLAYLIEKQSEGYYVLIGFKSNPEFITELNRVYNITEGVLRTAIKKIEVKPAKVKKTEEAPAAEAVETEAAAE
jgi:small subunit ribosomal protein S6